MCGSGRSVARGAALAFTVVIRETPQRRLEVSRRLLLDLVCERVDLESVQPGDVNVTLVSMNITHKAHTQERRHGKSCNYW